MSLHRGLAARLTALLGLLVLVPLVGVGVITPSAEAAPAACRTGHSGRTASVGAFHQPVGA